VEIAKLEYGRDRGNFQWNGEMHRVCLDQSQSIQYFTILIFLKKLSSNISL
jgi:hypothetical protein